MRSYITGLFIFSAILCLQAQPLKEVPYPMMIETAEEAMMQKDYYNALHWYEEAYKEERDPEVRYKIALLHYKLRDFKRAERYYARVVADDEFNRWPEAVFDYARILKINEKYNEAIEAFNAFAAVTDDEELLAKADVEVAGIQFAAKAEAPIELVIENAGRDINSSYSDLSPRLTDGELLYFASMPSKDVIILDGKEGDYFGKIFKSEKDKKGEWDKPDALPDKINRGGFHTGNPAFNPEGDIMYFTRALLEASDVVESKINISYAQGAGWGAPMELEGGVNGDFISTYPCAAELYGEDAIIFSSNMPGGEGGMDLYYSPKKGESEFGLPVNLGPGINTPGDEVTPFFINNILYFSSDGHPGFGSYDIFSVEWNGASWENPKNMGAGYNTGTDDYYYSVNLAGKKGFLVSNRPADDARSVKSKTCCDDIYTFNLRDLILDLRTFVFDEKENELPGATVSLFTVVNNRTGEPVVKTNPDSNNFAHLLDTDKSYKVVVERDGYFPDNFTFNTVGKTKNETFKANIYLKRDPSQDTGTETVTINQPIRLNNIYYDFDDDKILPDAEKDLSYLIELMDKYPDMVIELSSHTDARGNDRYNQRLSQRRAQSATNWLIERGNDPSRIEAVGYGESQILNQCVNGVECTDDEHRFNRRTEFKIIAGPTSIEVRKDVMEGEQQKKN